MMGVELKDSIRRNVAIGIVRFVAGQMAKALVADLRAFDDAPVISRYLDEHLLSPRSSSAPSATVDPLHLTPPGSGAQESPGAARRSSREHRAHLLLRLARLRGARATASARPNGEFITITESAGHPLHFCVGLHPEACGGSAAG